MKSDSLTVASRQIIWGARTYVMAILNVTTDSFSGDGLLAQNEEDSQESYVQEALNQARICLQAGADILDIGGESSRPGALPVSTDEEISRVLPVIQSVAAELDTIISVDTYKAEVAEAALQAGAHMINDVWGLRADPELGKVASKYRAPIVLMHNRSSWVHADIKERLGGRYVGMEYDDLLNDVKRELLESVELAHRQGIPDDHIILDPGIGFGKTVEQNLDLINRLGELREPGYPLLLGASRKSFIGYTLNLPPDQRIEGTAAAVAIGIDRGADIIRVHDVAYMVRVARMSDAISRRRTIK